LEGLESVIKQINSNVTKPKSETECETVFLPTLQDKAIPDKDWVVEGWILNNCVTALYGDGGVGKSLLTMQILTCVASGIDFLGIKTQKIKVFGFFCEDTADELHRRQADINNHYKIQFSQLENMHWQSRVGCDNILMNFIRDGVGSASKAYEYLLKEVKRVGARLVVIDTAADTFGGNENIRSQVRQFINLLGKLALEINGAVILCAHPSAAGLANNSGTGGSTAWNNTVRSRLYLSRLTANSGEEFSPDDARDLRELTKMKSNYSTVGDKFVLRWDNGAFRVEAVQANDFVSQIEKRNQEKADDAIFLVLLDQLTNQGRTVSNSKNAGSTYAPKVMALIDKGKSMGRKRLADAMERLFQNDIIDIGYVTTGSDRKKKNGVRRIPQNECSEVQHG